MSRISYILAILLCTIFSNGQQITFEPNINPDARELKQILTKNKDSLILESKQNIRQVDIFNENYFKSLIVDSTITTIDFNKLPLGNFIIKARLGKKRIVMYLKKQNENNSEAKHTTLEIKKELETSSSVNKEETINQSTPLYWVVHESNSSFGSHKSMSLEYKDTVNRLISKNKLELKSEISKNNKLLIFEVYNKSKFMTKQLRNHHYYKSKKSKVFNVVPIYKSANTSKINP